MYTISKKSVRILSIALPVIGLIVIVLYSLTASGKFGVHRAIGLLTLVACASFLSGGLGGLLFGIPKKNEANMNKANSANYIANTNLEEISDWLTKMIVGIGLVQIDKLSNWIVTISENIIYPLNLSGGSSIYVTALIIYFFIIGFIEGYLGTRVFLPRVFSRAAG